MSKLIDDIVKMNVEQEFKDGYFIAKPYDWQICSIPTFFEVIKKRFSEAFEILIGKAIAVHYKEDEENGK